jgi:hypothetical protein
MDGVKIKAIVYLKTTSVKTSNPTIVYLFIYHILPIFTLSFSSFGFLRLFVIIPSLAVVFLLLLLLLSGFYIS